MVPRPAVRRERNNDYSAVGTAGRRTGVTLPQGRLDENGLEEITGLFSSPQKPSPVKRVPGRNGDDAQNSTFEASEDMFGIDSSGLTPTHTLSTRRSLGAPALPPPRSASPRKSGIGGSARRSNGIDISSPSKAVEQSEAEDEENTPTPTPKAAKARRFVPSPEKRALQEVIPNGDVMASQRNKTLDKPYAEHKLTQPSHQQRELENQPRHEKPSEERANDMQADEQPLNPMGDEEVEEFLSSVENTMQDVSLVSGTENEAIAEPVEKVVESIEPAPPVKAARKPAAEKKTGKKRKSEEIADEQATLASSSLSSSAQPAKKARSSKPQTSKAKGKQKMGPSVDQDFPPNPARIEEVPQPTLLGISGKEQDTNTQLSQRQQAELDQIIEKVRSRPGKLKSLYVLKRQKSQGSGPEGVRSGRTTVKPLAYWTAEQCVHDEGGANLAPGARIPLNRIQKIDDSGSKSKGGHNTADEDDVASLNEYQSDGYEEAWEQEIGIFRGPTGIWDQAEQTIIPDKTEETDLAYHPSTMLTREVKGSGFKFAKLISTPFFGSGILDLPTGTIKRPKNSRTMHMCFFVFKGRVTVRIGKEIEENQDEGFSIGKGGIFQVPRGNKYSIENVLEKPARIFFSQGCETMAES